MPISVDDVLANNIVWCMKQRIAKVVYRDGRSMDASLAAHMLLGDLRDLDRHIAAGGKASEFKIDDPPEFAGVMPLPPPIG